MSRRRGERPWRRAILVEAPVSSMKTSFSGSRSDCALNQARCRRAMSGRCCSLACAFFERDAAPLEEAPQRALRDPQPMRPFQMRGDLPQRHVRRLIDQGPGSHRHVPQCGASSCPCPEIAVPHRSFGATDKPISPPSTAATRKRSTAAGRVIPPSTVAINRCRKSFERGFVMQAGLLHKPGS